MAQRMALSRSKIPDAHASVQVDCSALLTVRDRLREEVGDDGPPITPFVLTLRLLTIALTHHPMFNSTWVDTAGGPHIHVHSAVHLGIGVAAPRGLLVPVVKDAQDKSTRELAVTVARLDRGGAGGHRETGGAARVHIHGVELRRTRTGRGSARHQLSRSRDPRHGVVEAAGGRRRRSCGGAADDDVDVCVRPSDRRRRTGRRVPRRVAAS